MSVGKSREGRELQRYDAAGARLVAGCVPLVNGRVVLITNRKDEANLKRPEYRAKLVERLARAIVAYLVEYGPQR